MTKIRPMQKIVHKKIQRLYYHNFGIDETEYSQVVSYPKEKLGKYDLLKKEDCY